nr:PREDICTED: immunoglobulin superfamily member 1 [Anolis carolinensis]|eukprot:XP_008115435.1 PREDICTED: immunoglobulin superfamily member 1 [Anolis carolinensis]
MFAVHAFAPGEQFCCSYEIQEAGKAIYSPLSSPANITEDHYPKPFIAVSPGNELFVGQDWIIRCWAPSPGVNFVLYQSREFRMEITPRGDSSVAEFFLNNVTMADAGRYTCYYHSTTEPVIWSNASDAAQLTVIEASKVPSYQEVLVDSAGRYRVNCSVPSSPGGWFYLYQGKQLIAETKVWQDRTEASFNLTEEALNTTQGELMCQYGAYPLNHTEVWTEASHTESTDFTTANSLQLGLGVSVLLLALFFIVDACWTEVQEEN